MDKNSYRAQKIIQEKEKKLNRNTGGTTSAQWDDVAKKYTDTITGYKYTFTFDGAEDVLVLQTNRTLSNGGVVHSKQGSSRISRKKWRHFAPEGVRKHGQNRNL